jgi:hypothetical protein
VTSSEACQRFAEKTSLDSLTRRKVSDSLKIFNNSFHEELSSLPSAYILEVIPSWIATPATVDISSCNVVCWPASSTYQIDPKGAFQTNIDEIIQCTRNLVIFTAIQVFVIIFFYHRGYLQHRNYFTRIAPLPTRSAITADLIDTLKSSGQTIRWTSFSVIILVFMSKDSLHDPMNFSKRIGFFCDSFYCKVSQHSLPSILLKSDTAFVCGVGLWHMSRKYQTFEKIGND